MPYLVDSFIQAGLHFPYCGSAKSLDVTNRIRNRDEFMAIVAVRKHSADRNSTGLKGHDSAFASI